MLRDLIDWDLTKDVLPVTVSYVDQHIGRGIVWALFFKNKAIFVLKERLETTTTNTESCLLNNGCHYAVVEFQPLLIDWGLDESEVMTGS